MRRSLPVPPAGPRGYDVTRKRWWVRSWRSAGASRSVRLRLPGRTRGCGGSRLPRSTPRCPGCGTRCATLLRDRAVPVDDDILHGLLLILSELVTNAVKHAAVLSPEVAVEVAVGAEWVRVAVEDKHPYRPKALETDHARTGGRGLLLVKTITDEAGGSCDIAQTPGGGKVIWVALPLRPAAG